MGYWGWIFQFIWLIITFIASGYSLLSLIINREDYAITLISFFNIFLIIINGILFPVILFIIINILYPDLSNLPLFLGVIIMESLTVWIYSFDLNLLKEYGRLSLFSFLYFSILFSILVGILISISNIEIQNANSEVLLYLHTIVKAITTLYNLSILIYLIYTSMKIRMISKFKNLSTQIVIFTVLLSLSILSFCISVILKEIISIHSFVLLFTSTFIFRCVIILKHPKIYVKLTNKIYYIHIYHKTGVLLYSYDFENNTLQTDSMIWGNILIGLNHILSEFINKEEQIEVFQTQNAEIVVNYNNDLGFAVLLITNQKNRYIESCMERFMMDFEKRYETELKEIQDINEIINVIEFKETKQLIEKNFKIFFD